MNKLYSSQSDLKSHDMLAYRLVTQMKIYNFLLINKNQILFDLQLMFNVICFQIRRQNSRECGLRNIFNGSLY